MKGLTRKVLFASIACLFALALSNSASAQLFGGRLFGGNFNQPGRFGWGGSYNSFPTDPPLPPMWKYDSVRRAPTYGEYHQYMNSHFPKYNGGFHANYFQSIGVPPGDVGLRGNGIFQNPW